MTDRPPTDLPEWVVEKFRQFGKLGGRPRTVAHSDFPGCRCMECKKKAQGKPRNKKEKK